MPPDQVQELESRYPNFVKTQLTVISGRIDSRLRVRRYAVPFEAPYPPTVRLWLNDLATLRCYLRMGVKPTDEQFSEIKNLADVAEAQITEAADAVNGKFDLPMRADTTTSGITGGPLGYSEQSPYTGADRQAAAGKAEDGR